MKRIASFVALILFSAMSFAAVSITVTPSNVDFGTISTKDATGITSGSITFDVTYSGIQPSCGVYFDAVDMPESNVSFSITGVKTAGYIYGGDQYNPAEGKGLTLNYAADKYAEGTYTGKFAFWSYEDEDWTVPSTPVYMTIKLIVTKDAIVPKTIPFVRVNSLSELKNNDTIVFVSEAAGAINNTYDGSKAYMDTLKTNVKINASTGEADVPETAQMFKVVKYSDNWQFVTADAAAKRLHLDVSGKGAFTFADTQAGSILANWGISISSGVATVSKPDGTFPVRFNSDRFKPYSNASTGTDFALYKKAGSAVEIKSKLEIGEINFGEVELGEEKEITVNYTGENLTANIMWDITGTDKALFSVSPDESTNRTSGSIKIKYKGTATAVKTVSAKLYAYTQDAKLDDLEKEVSISITLVPNTIKLTKIEFVSAPTQIDQGQSIDMSQYIVYTPNDAADKSLVWTTDHDYQGTVTDKGVLTARKVTGNVVVTATSAKVPSVSASATLKIVVPTITDFTISDTELAMTIGDTKQLSVTAYVPSYASATASYTSSNSEVAAVSKNGLITAKAEGTANITVTIGEVEKVCAVTVSPVTVTSVTFDPNTKELAVGATYQLKPVVTPSAAESQYTASYESNKTSVATVSETGLVTAVAEGTAEITCTLGGKSGKITITVVGAKYFTKVTDATTLKAKDTIILAVAGGAGADAYAIVAGARNTDKKALSVVKEGVTITADAAAADQALQFVLGEATGGFTLTPVGSSTAIAIGTSNDIVNATASNNKVWEFLADGTNGIYVHNTGTNTNGYGYLKYHISNNVIKAYKTTTTGAVYVYVYVRPYAEPVKPAATGVSLSQTEYSTHVGDAGVTLTATVTPSEADQEVIWESSDNTIATVSTSGKVVAKSVGDVTITAKVKSNESLKATCLVHVIAWAVEYVEFDDASEETIHIGEELTVSATAYPTGHGFKVDYYTSDEKIATVTIGGKVTGVAAGDVTITAKSGDKEATKLIHVVAAPVPEDKGAISIADFLKAKDDFNIYTLTGVVSNIKEDKDGVPYKKGEFTITDNTGSIAIYGILTPDGVADKFWEMDIEEKDTVTLKGSYDEYKGTPQIKNGTLVSVKKYVEPTTALETVGVRTKATKVIREGQVIIIREEKEFDVVGRRVK